MGLYGLLQVIGNTLTLRGGDQRKDSRGQGFEGSRDKKNKEPVDPFYPLDAVTVLLKAEAELLGENELVCFRPWNAGTVSAVAEEKLEAAFEQVQNIRVIRVIRAKKSLLPSRLWVSIFFPATSAALNKCCFEFRAWCFGSRFC